MAQRYNTLNPRPSNSMKDLNDNALAYDDYLNSDDDEAIDRFGRGFPTVRKQVNERIDELGGYSKNAEESAAAAKTSEQNAANSLKAVTAAGFSTGPIHRADVYAQGNTSFINRFNGTSANVPAAVLGSVLSMPMDGGPTCGYIAVSSGRAAWIGISNFSGKTVSWVSLWSSGNTTVDANGFIKKASPIARLSGAPEKMTDDYLDGFTLSGFAAVNAEAAGVSAVRVSVGVYKVTGALGFAEEGWNIEVPQDVNGNRLCFVSANTGKDGTIYVKVSKRRFDIDTAAIVAGEPMDIPAGRWIDLRLEMPVREVEVAPEAGEKTAALENGNVDPI